MIISTNQPYFAPYPGFFYKAQLSDCLVILDGVQFPRKTTWITRNRFKNDQGTLWMTIPVRKKGLGFQRISEVRICYAENWPQKYLRSFYHAYARAPFLSEYVGVMERVLSLQPAYLLDLNMEIINAILEYLKIDTQMVLMSELGVSGKGDTDRPVCPVGVPFLLPKQCRSIIDNNNKLPGPGNQSRFKRGPRSREKVGY